MIDFKTHDEQIDILRARGMQINNPVAVKDFLVKNNYYNVVNAYKDLFIIKGQTPETYIKGTTFRELIALHQFDKELREFLSHVLILIERMFKSVTAYEFTKHHKNHDYLDINNFDVQNKTIAASKIVTYLNDTLQNELIRKNKMICHNKAKYNVVPLWVFVNVLTFGDISWFFSALKQNIQTDISQTLSSSLGKVIYSKDLKNMLKILVLLRNMCAHDQRIFDFSSEKLTVPVSSPLLKKYDILVPKHDLFGAFSCIEQLMTNKDYIYFYNRFRKMSQELFQNLHSIPPQKILDKMGVPSAFIY